MLLSFIKTKISALMRKLFINTKLRNSLKNKGMSVLASNCNGAFMLHDLGQPFNSPFVNLYLKPQDFIRYLQRIEHYQQQPLKFVEDNDKPYPVAYLDDIKIHFVHYANAQQAQEKWQQRSQRIDLDNLFIIMTDRDGCTEQDLNDFDALPYKNKVVFTHKPYPEIRSAFYIEGFEQQDCVGDLFAYSGWLGKRYYDQFDYLAWFNQNKNEKTSSH
ncbi:Exopolysaccharide biosynthesis protein [uncultured Avibacterium sp.]|uniref:Exopolysaccharide biosynthesis protein n=1 Tax=uncultured Avibacterium sp. TaxID=1936169 RepID=A0A486XAB4_9PAST|nr:Exopolysaccharide biosynthesis protein [uncultured Avibacterium sp.]